MVTIKILGPGCNKCKATEAIAKKVLEKSDKDFQLDKIEDMQEIMKYPILSTPAVVFNGEVKIQGHVPSESEFSKILDLYV